MEASQAAGFSLRHEPLKPVAAAASGKVAFALAKRLLLLGDERLASLRGVAGRDVLIVTGEADALPWVDGAVYLGSDPLAPRLLIPATIRPDVAPDLFERAIARRAAPLPSPWAVLLAPPRVLSVAHVSVVDRGVIRDWLEAAT